ncbi:MAG TPA: SDR family NAD(P)-dependent oxidoreductase [Steroidobacteraceae bacterium]|nr:SDR family NAD(P)-dependent oxidoreductase [Steroidobacteraceae bacterium]
MNSDCSDHVVLVTGGSSGLGRAIAVESARRGAKAVIVNYSRSEADAQETAEAVRGEGATPVVVKADVSNDAECQALVRAASRFGRIDALYNNAGTTKFAVNQGALDALSGEDFLHVYHVNVVGAFQMVRAARSLLEAAPSPGAVVNTSSLAGATGLGSSIAYAASKGALNTLTLSLARVLAPKVRVNAICPGYIDTRWFRRAMSDAEYEVLRRSVMTSTALKTVSTAEDIAASAVFLGSRSSRHMTGELLTVDAGLHLGVTPVKTSE